MSVGPIGGVIGSAAGAPLAQTKGSESERSKRDAAAQDRSVETNKKTEKTAGVGETQQDEGASDRDADGRRLWEKPETAETQDEPVEQPIPSEPRSKDASGQAGGQLDLLG